MKRSRIHLIQTTCRRCGRPVTTLDRPLVASAAMHARYSAICDACFTPADREALDQDYRQALPAAIRAGVVR